MGSVGHNLETSRDFNDVVHFRFEAGADAPFMSPIGLRGGFRDDRNPSALGGQADMLCWENFFQPAAAKVGAPPRSIVNRLVQKDPRPGSVEPSYHPFVARLPLPPMVTLRFEIGFLPQSL